MRMPHMFNDLLARIVNTPSQFRCLQAQQQSNAVSAAMMDLVDAGVGTIFDHTQAPPRKASGRFALAVFQELVYPANALVGRVNIGRNTTLGKPVDRVNASLGNTFRIGRVCSVGCLGCGELLAGQHRECRNR